MEINILTPILILVIVLLIMDNAHQRWVNKHLRDTIRDLKEDYEMFKLSLRH